MAKKFQDLTGQVFGRLTVIRTELYGTRHHWLCLCTCGTSRIVHPSALRLGRTRSCGCLHDEVAKQRATKHGLHSSPSYKVWENMLSRCRNPNIKGAHNYVNRGITVCEEWLTFATFYQHNGPRPFKHTLERVNNNKGYGPTNCMWAPIKVQGRNKRNNHPITFRGATQCLSAWAEQLGIHGSTLKTRLERWGIEKALTTKKLH